MGGFQAVSAPLRAALGRLFAVADVRDGDPVWPRLAAAALRVLQDTQPPYEPVAPLDLGHPVLDGRAELGRAVTDLGAAMRGAASGSEALRCASAAQQLRNGLARNGSSPPVE